MSKSPAAPVYTIKAELTKYCRDILADRPLSCQKHKWACLRFLDDLKRSAANDPEFPYVFDEARAERFLTWMGFFKHRKGKLKGQKIEPHITHKFICGNIYGWVHRSTGYRRFNKAYWQVGRKNSKSQTGAEVGTYEAMALDPDGLEASEVYCAATKTEQARVVYDEAVAMLEQSDFFKGKNKFTEAYNRITHHKSGSIMRPLSKEDRKTGDGLNPQCGIIDEYHAHDTSEIYDIISTGMGARTQPLLLIITTAGFDLDHPCYRVEYDLVSKILDPNIPVKMENYFACVHELDKNGDGEITDDIKDPAVWVKANPIVCSYPEGVDFLKKQLAEALEAPEKMRNFLTKHMNAWMQMKESGYMNMERWTACKQADPKNPELKKISCYVGLDMSAKIDLTSASFEFRVGEVYHIFSHSFMPDETLLSRQKQDKVPYHQWVKSGHITVTPGSVVDYRTVKEYVLDYAGLNGWKIAEWCIDPWGNLQLSAELAEQGQHPVEIIQGIKTLSEPTKDFRNMVYSGRIINDHSPVLAWAMSNAIVESVGRNDNIILTKNKSRQRIDPVAATINAHVRAMTVQNKSVYEARGMRSLL